MALQIKLSQDSISADGLTMVIKDITGNYDATTNLTGYNAPNAARNTLGLFLLCFNERYDGSATPVPTALSVVIVNPLTDSSWTVTLLKQGWQQAIVYGLRLYSTATLFAVNEVVYDSVSGEQRQILTVSGVGPYTYTYTVITTATLISPNTTKAYQTVFNNLATPTLNVCLNSTREYYFTTKLQVDFDRMLKIEAYLKSINYSFASGSYGPAQLKVEQVEKLCTCFTVECGC